MVIIGTTILLCLRIGTKSKSGSATYVTPPLCIIFLCGTHAANYGMIYLPSTIIKSLSFSSA